MNIRLCITYIAFLMIALWAGNDAIGESFSITNSVSVLDALGERTYEGLDVRELIGPTNYIEVVGYDKQGEAESAGYSGCATPHWKECIGVPKSRRVCVLPLHKMTGQAGGGANVHTVSLASGGQKKTFVQIDGNDSPANSVGCQTRRDAIGGEMYGVGASQAVLEGLDENSGSLVRTTLYTQGSDVVKLWYEILNRDNAAVEKGYVSAKMYEKGLCDADVKVVVGKGLAKPSLNCVMAHANCRVIQCHFSRGVSSASMAYVLPTTFNNVGRADNIP